LIFQLWSHAHLYDEDGENAPMKSTKYPRRPPRDPNHLSRFQRAKNALRLRRKNGGAKGAGEDGSVGSNTVSTEAQSTVRSTTAFTATSATVENGSMLTPVNNAEATQRRAKGDDAGPVGQDLEVGAEADADYEESENEEEVPQLTAGVALGLLMVVTVVRFPFLLFCNVESEGLSLLVFSACSCDSRIPRQFHRWSYLYWPHFGSMGRFNFTPHRRQRGGTRHSGDSFVQRQA
jgi:hypothetical protein